MILSFLAIGCVLLLAVFLLLDHRSTSHFLFGSNTQIDASWIQPGGVSEDKRALRDLFAQEAMARWAMFAAGAAMLSLAISGFGLWALLQSLNLTRAAVRSSNEANLVSREIGQAQVRANLFVKSFSSTVHFSENSDDSNSVSNSFKIEIANYGESRALNLQLSTSYYCLDKILAIRSDLNTEARLGAGTLFLDLIHPDETVTFENESSIFGIPKEIMYSEDEIFVICIELYFVDIFGEENMFENFYFAEHFLEKFDGVGNFIFAEPLWKRFHLA